MTMVTCWSLSDKCGSSCICDAKANNTKILHPQLHRCKTYKPRKHPKNFPKHLRGQAKKELQQLIKQDIINQHPTSYEPQISLNPKKLEDIKKNTRTLKQDNTTTN